MTFKKNNWELNENAEKEKLEEWQEEDYLLTEFYNAEDIIGVKNSAEIISLRDGV